MVAACAGPQRDARPAAVARPAPPGYAEVAARYNQRVAPMERLWARTVVGLWYRDREGRSQREQLEGHLQYLRPDRLLLTFDKLGNTYAALGSNAERYWWIEREPEPRAFTGEHAKATPERIAELGLPVHPLNFIELLGITPLPMDAAATEVRWTEDGRYLLVTAPARLGPRRLWLDPQNLLPARVELLGTGGEVVAAADLNRYQEMAVRAPIENWHPSVPGTVEATQERDELRVRMVINEPETAGRRPEASRFDFDRVARSLGVREVISLDEPAPVPAARAGP